MTRKGKMVFKGKCYAKHRTVVEKTVEEAEGWIPMVECATVGCKHTVVLSLDRVIAYPVKER